MGLTIPAREISISLIGRTVRSLVYPNKNKTAKPRPKGVRDGQWVREPWQYTIDSIYAHANGNILINGDYYLRGDTEVEVLDIDGD